MITLSFYSIFLINVSNITRENNTLNRQQNIMVSCYLISPFFFSNYILRPFEIFVSNDLTEHYEAAWSSSISFFMKKQGS